MQVHAESQPPNENWPLLAKLFHNLMHILLCELLLAHNPGSLENKSYHFLSIDSTIQNHLTFGGFPAPNV